MFNKNNDVYLKITNMVLIIIATIFLGIAIGSNYYKENLPSFGCGSDFMVTRNEYGNAKNNYHATCLNYSNIDTHDNYRIMSIAYSIFGTSIIALIICNATNKRK